MATVERAPGFGKAVAEATSGAAVEVGLGVLDGKLCLELPAVQDKPRVWSTALMWLLAARRLRAAKKRR